LTANLRSKNSRLRYLSQRCIYRRYHVHRKRSTILLGITDKLIEHQAPDEFANIRITHRWAILALADPVLRIEDGVVKKGAAPVIRSAES
jgi:hypothetical protein